MSAAMLSFREKPSAPRISLVLGEMLEAQENES